VFEGDDPRQPLVGGINYESCGWGYMARCLASAAVIRYLYSATVEKMVGYEETADLSPGQDGQKPGARMDAHKRRPADPGCGKDADLRG
jgi:hypothetical protein